jgi:hypothetical protein
VVLEARVSANHQKRETVDAKPVFGAKVSTESLVRHAIATVSATLLPVAVIGIPVLRTMLLPGAMLHPLPFLSTARLFVSCLLARVLFLSVVARPLLLSMVLTAIILLPLRALWLRASLFCRLPLLSMPLVLLLPSLLLSQLVLPVLTLLLLGVRWLRARLLGIPLRLITLLSMLLLIVLRLSVLLLIMLRLRPSLLLFRLLLLGAVLLLALLMLSVHRSNREKQRQNRRAGDSSFHRI